jgi:hypothetical protein
MSSAIFTRGRSNRPTSSPRAGAALYDYCGISDAGRSATETKTKAPVVNQYHHERS